MAKIIVLGGGKSDEREVSLRSSKAVLTAIESLNIHVEFVDPKFSNTYLRASPKDIIMPILHGVFGEDGTLQKQLENHSLSFLGSGSQSSKNSFDKWKTREILQKNDIAVAPGAYLAFREYSSHPFAGLPHVIKLNDGGSSIGTYIIREPAEYSERELEKFFDKQKMIIEQLIIGTEITVPILGNTALPVIEIKPPKEGEFDYANKYNGKTQEICPPISVNTATQKKAQKLAEKVHHLLGCRHLSRVDIMIDQQNKMYVLEINTMPGLTEQSLFPLSAKVAGMDMPQLVGRLLGLVARDYALQLSDFKI